MIQSARNHLQTDLRDRAKAFHFFTYINHLQLALLRSKVIFQKKVFKAINKILTQKKGSLV